MNKKIALSVLFAVGCTTEVDQVSRASAADEPGKYWMNGAWDCIVRYFDVPPYFQAHEAVSEMKFTADPESGVVTVIYAEDATADEPPAFASDITIRMVSGLDVFRTYSTLVNIISSDETLATGVGFSFGPTGNDVGGFNILGTFFDHRHDSFYSPIDWSWEINDSLPRSPNRFVGTLSLRVTPNDENYTRYASQRCNRI